MEITNELRSQALYRAIAEDKDSEYYFQKLIENCMNYAIKHNNSKANWTARELFEDVLEEDLIEMLFNEE